MEAELQRRVQRYGWDRASTHYEPSWKNQLYPAQRLLLAIVDIQPGERVLETACGTGLVTQRIALATGPEGRVVATDLSDRMVEATRQRADNWGMKQVTVYQADAERLPMPEQYFDVALCALGMMYYPDPLEALRQMHRVLRRGGRAASLVWGQRQACGWNAIFPIVDARVKTDVCPLFFQLGTGHALQHHFAEAGFSDIETRRLQVDLHYADDKQALDAVFAGGPVAMAYARFDRDTKAEVHQEYLRSIEPYRDGEGYRIPGEFVVAMGRKA